MKSLHFVFYSIFSVLIAVNAFALINDVPEDNLHSPVLEDGNKIRLPYVDKKNIVDVFLSAVDFSGLEALDVKIDRQYLEPVQIEIVYEIGYSSPLIRVISRVNPPVPVPHIGQLFITKISVTMNLEGEIVDVLVHSDY